MNIFKNFFFKSKEKPPKETNIIAPISGNIIQLSDVPDEIFSKKTTGEGIAINPTGSVIVAPCNGTIKKISSGNHAFAMRSRSGLEIFVQFGLNTIKLNGYGFKRIISKPKTVYTGEVIITLDLEKIRIKAKSIITPVIISNTEIIKKITKYSGIVQAGITKIMKITQ